MEIKVNFDKQISELLAELRAVSKDMQAEADEVVSEFVDNTFIPSLKKDSPSSDGTGSQKRPKYRDGWIKKKSAKTKSYWVSNANRPELTYMLEHGFERTYTNKTTGKPRKTYTAAPRPHIRPTIENTEKILIQNLKDKLIGG